MTGRFHCSITGFSKVDRLYQSADRCSPLPIHERPPVATADGQAPQHAAAAFRDFATPSCRWWFRNRRGTLRTPAESRSEEHTSELQSLMRISYAVFCLIKTYTTTQQSCVLEVNTLTYNTITAILS